MALKQAELLNQGLFFEVMALIQKSPKPLMGYSIGHSSEPGCACAVGLKAVRRGGIWALGPFLCGDLGSGASAGAYREGPVC